MTTVTELSKYVCVCSIPPLGAILAPILMNHYRVSKKAIRRIFMGLVVFHILLCFFVYLLAGGSEGSRRFIGTFPIIAYYFLFLALCLYRDGRILFTCISILLLCTICSALCTLITPYGSLLWALLWCLILTLIAFLMERYFRKPFNKMLHGVADGWLIRSLLPLLLLFSLLTEFIFPMLNNDHSALNYKGGLLLCAIAVLLYVHLYQYFRTVQWQYDLQRDAALLQTQINVLGRQAEIAAAADKNNATFRHDQRHLLTMMHASLSAGDTQGAERVLEAMKNALENALNACSCLPPGEERSIRLLAGVTGKQFFMTLSNTFCGSIRFDPDSGLPVSDKNGHGYGTRSIAAFVQKNNGILEYSTDHHWFILNLLLG
ncbi:MAG: GHKL domain-containing protein [Lachnospiraceae bacterium]|nr:GHKL domain-containing protein [Lachnospiraceae bacterium]